MKGNNIAFFGLYLAALLLIIYFRQDENIIFAILTVTVLGALALHKVAIIPVIILTLLFAIVENVCVYYGLWKYSKRYTKMPYVPLWLYLAWAAAIIFILKLYGELFGFQALRMLYS